MTPKNYYQILQVDPSASSEVIEAAYKRLAKIYHPDINRTPGAVKTMQELNQAYQTLNDPAQRRQYDEYLKTESAQYASRESNPYADPSYGQRKSYAKDHTDQWAGFPATCQKCGKSDSSLRIASFPYVISIIFVTFRRQWGGLYCRQCRTQEMRKAKLLSMFLGWWGIPFGFFYTLGVLFKPSGGEIPPIPNAEYLRGLAGFFLNAGKLADAEEALKSSLYYDYDNNVAETYRQIFGKQPDSRKPDDGSNSGAFFGIAAIAIIGFIIWSFAATGSTGSQNGGSSRSVQIANPTRAGAVAVLEPTATATPQPTALKTGAKTDAKIGIEKPSAGKLRESVIPPTPKPTSQVVMNAHGYDWVQYSSPNISILYPNGWSIESEAEQIFSASEDNSLDLWWYDLENDVSWLFEYDNQKSTLMQSLIRDVEQEYSDEITENLGEIVHFDLFEQAELGGMPTLGEHVYELEVTNNWEDGDTIYIGYGEVLCAPTRICHFEYQKIDEPFTERDWAILDTFAASVEFK